MAADVNKTRHIESQCVLPGTISGIKTQEKRIDRVNVYVDDAFCFACRSEVAMRFHLSKGLLLSPELRDNVLQEDAFLTAYGDAIELLAYRARSEREIATRLRRKGCDVGVIERVIDRLIENRYLDDAAFARAWIENRSTHRPRGNRALHQELRFKGVDTNIIGAALENADLDQAALAIDAARKRSAALAGLPPDVQRRRMIGFLQRRGFSWDAINPALTEILGQAEELDNEETE